MKRIITAILTLLMMFTCFGVKKVDVEAAPDNNQGDNQNYAVYVYVCAEYPRGTRIISDDALALLGLDSSTIDTYGYIPVGQVTIDSLITAKGGINSIDAGESLLTSESDWTTLLNALSAMDKSTLTSSDNSHVYGKDFTGNANNTVSDYISQAHQDLGASGSSGKSQLSLQYKGRDTASKYVAGFSNESQYYAVFHLDLFFDTKNIKFVTGNNGIGSGSAPDGTELDSRGYITGSVIQKPSDFSSKIPSGYYWDEKYYTDADFTTEWNGIETETLDEDKTVYIKLLEYGKARVNYEVAEGTGEVSTATETFYVTGTGTPKAPSGSTANAGTGYVFEGWYSDSSCTTKVSSNAAYVPTAPTDGWEENTEYTYYAKFVPATYTVTVSKTVTGSMGDKTKEFSFSVTSNKAITNCSSSVKDDNDDSITSDGATLNIQDKESVTLTIPFGATVTITETAVDGYTTTYTLNGGTTETGGNSYTISGLNSDVSIGFKNTKNPTVDVGIFTDSTPYIAMLGIVAVGTIALFMAHKHRHAE